jgi:hypothetical protein
MSDRIPKPIFILKNSGPITSVLFSEFKQENLFVSNRNGSLNIYDLDLRRSIFECNSNKESILSIIELNENTFLTYLRNGTIQKWTQTQGDWIFKSKILIFKSEYLCNYFNFKYLRYLRKGNLYILSIYRKLWKKFRIHSIKRDIDHRLRWANK